VPARSHCCALLLRLPGVCVIGGGRRRCCHRRSEHCASCCDVARSTVCSLPPPCPHTHAAAPHTHAAAASRSRGSQGQQQGQQALTGPALLLLLVLLLLALALLPPLDASTSIRRGGRSYGRGRPGVGGVGAHFIRTARRLPASAPPL